jgi:cytochrome P450
LARSVAWAEVVGSTCRCAGAACIGDHFAILEVTLALATIVRRVDVRSLDAHFATDVPFTAVAAGPIRPQVRQRI